MPLPDDAERSDLQEHPAADKPQTHRDLRLIPRAQGDRLSTLSRGLSILEYVATSKRFVRLTDVAQHFGLDRSAALRYLRTLELDGYVVRHEAMKFYSIGPKLLSLPRLPASVERMIEIARPVLADLGRNTGQIAHLAVLSGSQAVLVEVAPSLAPVSVKQAVGDLEPLNSSAVGKAIFAHLPEDERRTLGRQIEFRQHTSRTITDLTGLEAEGPDIRSSGVAFDRQEGNDQVSCIGVPILDVDHKPIASIGVSYVSAHLPRPVDQMQADIDRVVAAARQVEGSFAMLGLAPDDPNKVEPLRRPG